MRLEIDKNAIVDSVFQEDETFDFSRFDMRIVESQRSDAIHRLRKDAAEHIGEIDKFIEIVTDRITMLTTGCEGPLTMRDTDTLGRNVMAILCSSPIMPKGEDTDTVTVVREEPEAT